MPDTTTRTYVVSGMSCSHCAAAVEREVGALPEVTRAEVALDAGRLTVSGGRIDDDAVAAAVERAGYEVVS